MSNVQFSNALNQLFHLVNSGQFKLAAKAADGLSVYSIQDPRYLHASGIAYLNSGSHDKALVQLEAFVQGVKGQHAILNIVADLKSKQRQFDEAESYFSQAIALSPNTYQYYFNFALSKIASEDLESAEALLNKTLELAPSFEKARKQLAKLLMQKQEHARAFELVNGCSEQHSDWTVFQLKAQVLEKLHKTDEAILAYERAIRLAPSEGSLWESLVLAHLTLGQEQTALEVAQQALSVLPTEPKLNLLCANLKFELGLDNPFEHYGRVIGSNPSDRLFSDYISLLLLQKSSDQAEQVLTEFKQQVKRQDVYLNSFCAVRQSLRDYEAVIAVLEGESAANLADNLLDFRAQAYIALGKMSLAQKDIECLLERSPNDQYYWALLATVYKHTDPEKYQKLYNLNELVYYVPLKVPAGYEDIEQFNNQLKLALKQLHITEKNPLNQSGRGGTQTPGFLFDQQHPVIQDLQKALKQTIEHAFADKCVKPDSNHPVLSRFTGQIDIVTAWSMWLKTGGYHVSHVHSKGWYSSAYYVSIPDEVNAESKQGAIGFGDPGIDLPVEGNFDKIIAPKAGYLALFPSMMWHGTIPFNSQEPRVVVAFDMLPAQ